MRGRLQKGKSGYQSKYSWITDELWQSWIDSGFIGLNRFQDGAFSRPYFEYSPNDPLFEQWLEFYDNYLRSIEQYKGSDTYELLANNPDLQFQNGLDQASLNSRFNSINEYKANILGARQQNRYNSTVAAAARDSAAGFNDALTGSLAGNGQAADNTPSEDTPMTGVSPDAQLAADVQERQNAFGRAMSVISLPLQFVQGVNSLLTGFSNLALLSPKMEEIYSNIEATRSGIGVQHQQELDLQASNKRAWHDQVVDILLSGEDLTAGVPNVSKKLKNLDRSTWSPEQSAYIDEQIANGVYAREDGAATETILSEYNKRLASSSTNARTSAQNLSQIGGMQGLSNPLVATYVFNDKFTKYQVESSRLDNQLKRESRGLTTAQKRLLDAQKRHEDLESALTSTENQIAGVKLSEENIAFERAKIDKEVADAEKEVRLRTAKIQGLHQSKEEFDASCEDEFYQLMLQSSPEVRAAMYATWQSAQKAKDSIEFGADIVGKLIPFAGD